MKVVLFFVALLGVCHLVVSRGLDSYDADEKIDDLATKEESLDRKEEEENEAAVEEEERGAEEEDDEGAKEKRMVHIGGHHSSVVSHHGVVGHHGVVSHGSNRWFCWGRYWYGHMPHNCHGPAPTTGLWGYDLRGYAQTVQTVSTSVHDIHTPRWWHCWGQWFYATRPSGCGHTVLGSPTWKHHVYDYAQWRKFDYRPAGLATEPCSFHYCQQPLSWRMASNFCVKNGMHLANLKTSYELQLAQRIYGTASPFWIGATNMGHAGQWQWMDTTVVQSSYFHGGHFGGLGHNCGFINWHHPGYWANSACSARRPFLCQIC